MAMIQERLNSLRTLMRERGMDAYLVPTADFHESEYVGDYFKCRSFMTGFTGSAGTLVVTLEDAALWVDGRYFVQAGNQLKGSSVRLMKMGEEGVPEISDFIIDAVKEGGCLGFDGRVVDSFTGLELEKRLDEKGASVKYQEDLIDQVWTDRPALSARPVWILKEEFAGKSASEKLSDLRGEMKKAGASVHVLTSLDDIAWLLNIRGDDVRCNPVVLSYLAVTGTEAFLFINPQVLDQETEAYLKGLGITLKPYDEIYEYIKTLQNEKVLLETARVNYAIIRGLDSSNEIINQMNPTVLAKAVKNPVEIENMKKAHIKDGVVMARFACWLKKNIGKIPMDEISLEKKLDSMRFETEGNLGLSFDTISAYGANAAMCHYSATEETNTPVEPRGFYLVDSGGQYYEGTTDITRTFAMGPLTKEEKEHYTLVLISMLRLGDVKFPYGARGLTLDYAARQVFWDRGLNFNHGTGHGVGYLLNVHERPVGIRWKMVPERMDSCVLEPGMISSDEPGIYIEGSHGIRTENLMLCVKREKNEYGQFLGFEYLTCAPIDLDGVEKSLMTDHDVELLNRYHAHVYETLSPYLEGEEKEWLKEATRAI
ncbi:MAG TPA: aminopeptidase P family protein [Candidatus Caccovicinus merdipullorum]|uniref:Aminopeptidase P family protein n=1 Tax=Candidatus Caccovicinus merdipullorum TaxID=2840724 RepID=A0A9D1KF87_9FIRM|nr:aminopeptidase P family protein [Candidatus Caccovicinus merdipullorum]